MSQAQKIVDSIAEMKRPSNAQIVDLKFQTSKDFKDFLLPKGKKSRESSFKLKTVS